MLVNKKKKNIKLPTCLITAPFFLFFSPAGFKIREIIKSEGNLVKDFHSLQFSQDEGKRLIKSYLVQSEMAYHSLEEYEEKYIETMRLWLVS